MTLLLEFDAAHAESLLATLPAQAAVFLLRPTAATAEPYVSKTANLRRRLERLLGAVEGRRLNLRERVARIEYELVGSDFEAQLTLYRLLRREFPHQYATRMHLRPAPLVQLLRENRYPRLTVTTKIRSTAVWRANGAANTTLYFGPFASRAEAEQYVNDSLDFFRLRRCSDEIAPDPQASGCAYSEMKMCLGPCFAGCTDARYDEEAQRVQSYLETRGRSLELEIERTRDEASAQLAFEQAATAHARLDKLKSVERSVAEIVHCLDQLNGLMLQPAQRDGSVALFRIAGGLLQGPLELEVLTAAPEANATPAPNAPSVSAATAAAKAGESMEARIRRCLQVCEPAAPHGAQEWMEHLALLKRWYYRSNKVGEIFFADEHGELPMRRIVRAVGRVLKGEKPAADLSETAGGYWAWRSREAGL